MPGLTTGDDPVSAPGGDHVTRRGLRRREEAAAGGAVGPLRTDAATSGRPPASDPISDHSRYRVWPESPRLKALLTRSRRPEAQPDGHPERGGDRAATVTPMTPPPSMRVAVLLALVLLAAGCGSDEGPDAPTLDDVQVPSWAKVAPEQIEAAKRHGVPVAFENELGMRFVLIPAGTFRMGSPVDEEGRKDDEAQHEVTISKPFYLLTTEVSNGHLHAVAQLAERGITSDRREGAAVRSYHRAVGFAARLSRFDPERSYRLPTEAEWEHACRAGSGDPFWWGDSREEAVLIAGALAEGEPTDLREAVERAGPGKLPSRLRFEPRPNRWGLHSMPGGEREWCSDHCGPYPTEPAVDPTGAPAGRCRVLRGGAQFSEARFMRSAARDWTEPDDGSFGFRLVSPLPEPGGSGR